MGGYFHQVITAGLANHYWCEIRWFSTGMISQELHNWKSPKGRMNGAKERLMSHLNPSQCVDCCVENQRNHISSGFYLYIKGPIVILTEPECEKACYIRSGNRREIKRTGKGNESVGGRGTLRWDILAWSWGARAGCGHGVVYNVSRVESYQQKHIRSITRTWSVTW